MLFKSLCCEITMEHKESTPGKNHDDFCRGAFNEREGFFNK